MLNISPKANALLRKFSAAPPEWFETKPARILIAKCLRLLRREDGRQVARTFRDRLALVMVSA